MAEFLWTFAVQEVLKKIVKFGAEQIGVAWELEKELFQLRKWLLKAEAILADINTKKLHHHSVRLWVEDLQDIVYEADDLLDELVYEDLRRTAEQNGTLKKVRNFISPSKNPFLFRYKMANKMKNITHTLYKHYWEASPLGLVGEESTTETEVALKQIRETTSTLDFETVGREIEVAELLKLVIDSSNAHAMSVISIVGMGGLGKTTLAKMVFNHDTIKEHFDQTIWVCVSKPFIVMKILEGIFQGLTRTCSGFNSKENLLQSLREEMQGKSYFLVLDDIWDKENDLWNELTGCLKQIAGKSGNSIMVTTRSVEVAAMVKTISIHHLEKLSDDQSWILFKENANANQLSMDLKLEALKNVLVRKMGGVPLVAKVLGGAIKFEEVDFVEGDHESWMTKVERITNNISREDTGFVLSILKLSVETLPFLALKQCFAYCSNFPEDYKFHKDTLIQMWIAQGYIHPQQERENLRMEDIGEEYFNFLLSRSLFQDVIKDENGRIVSFKMHDLIHEIACSVTHFKNLKLEPTIWCGESGRKLRTLICNNDQEICKFQNCVYLRVLVLKCLSSSQPQISMDKLIHLRYLDISKCKGNKLLQESLSLLYNLQTLRLGNIELPKNLKILVNLRHLEFYRIHGIKQMPFCMGKLIHLQTLSEFAVGFEEGCKIEEFGPLKNLKGRLKLTNLEKVQSKEEAMAAKLVEKKSLCHIIFQWTFSYTEFGEHNHIQVLEGLQPHKNLQTLNIIDYKGEVLPNGIFVENLVEVDLYRCTKCVVLPMLGQLPNLKKLEISLMDCVRSIGNEFYGIDFKHRNCFAFPKLKELYINGMKTLEQWRDELITQNLFGSLQKLIVFECYKLKKLPSGLEGCQSIEYLVINRCPNLKLNVKNLHNLRHLNIDGFKRSFAKGLGDLTNLKELMIAGDANNYKYIPFIDLSSQLVELGLTNDRSSNNVTTELPQQLQYLTHLKVLKFSNFDGIETLPEWLGNIISLRSLSFSNCKNLKELPSRDALLHLTKLEVFRCPKLLVGEGHQRGG